MGSLHPKNWSVICWLLMLVWLLPSVMMNAPIEPDLDKWKTTPEFIDLGNYSGERKNYRMVIYDQEVLIGWPFEYLKIAIGKPFPSVRTYNPAMVALNLVAIVLTLASLIFVVQKWIPRFTIRIMLCFVALVAVLISFGQFLFLRGHYQLQTIFLMAVYFSPVAATLIHLGYRKLRPEVSKTQNDRAAN